MGYSPTHSLVTDRGRASAPSAPRADRTVSMCLVPEATVAGTKHVGGIAEMAGELCRGDELWLARDVHNPYDPWATEVRNGRGRRLGYVGCEHNEVVGRLLDAGKDVGATVVSVVAIDGWTRIKMEVRLYG